MSDGDEQQSDGQDAPAAISLSRSASSGRLSNQSLALQGCRHSFLLQNLVRVDPESLFNTCTEHLSNPLLNLAGLQTFMRRSKQMSSQQMAYNFKVRLASGLSFKMQMQNTVWSLKWPRAACIDLVLCCSAWTDAQTARGIASLSDSCQLMSTKACTACQSFVSAFQGPHKGICLAKKLQ